MNKEVYFLKDNIVKIDTSGIRELKDRALLNRSGKFRYCFHECEEAAMQEMLLVMPSFGYARPHMHKEAAESHVIIDGEGYCVLFDLQGDVIECFKVSRNDNFLYRIQKGIFHMILPITNQIVIYEIREGKFDRSTNVYAEWSPKEYEKDKIEQYKLRILQQLGAQKILG